MESPDFHSVPLWQSLRATETTMEHIQPLQGILSELYKLLSLKDENKNRTYKSVNS